MRPFYVTTPIYYVNSVPTVGTAYTTIAGDVFSRYARLRGRPTRYLTGLDEHGLKIDRRAAEEKLTPQAFVDRMAPEFHAAWAALGIRFDDFIRTTEPRHVAKSQAFWQKLVDSGDIYLGDYEDWYCVGCESFKTEKELLPGNLCPDHKKPVERIKDLVNLQLPGVGLRSLPVAPRQLPYHAGSHYFELDRQGELWKQIERSGNVALHVSGDFPGLELELWAVRQP